MKPIFRSPTFILIFFISHHFVIGKSFGCIGNPSKTSFIISSILCDDKGNADSSDDMIRFTVTGENGRSSERISGWTSMPEVIDAHPTENVHIDSDNKIVNFHYGSTYYNVIFNVTSPGCESIDLLVSIEGCPDEYLILQPNGVFTIPTLGQWGFTLLFLTMIILGLIKIKAQSQRPIYLSSGY